MQVARLIAAVAFLLSGCFNRHPGTRYEARTVPGTMSPHVLRFDVQADTGGTVHLVWQGREQPLMYQQSRDGGQTWNEAAELGPALDRNRQYRLRTTPPRIFVHGETLSVVWPDARGAQGGLHVRQSYDGGRSWPETAEAAPPEPVVAPHPHIAVSFKSPYTLAQHDEDLLLSYPDRHGYVVRRSRDLGRSWSPPVKVADRHASGLGWSWATAAFYEDTWYVLVLENDARYEVRSETGATLGWRSLMYLVRSMDGGVTWTEPVEVPIEGLEEYSRVYEHVTDARDPEIHATPAGLWVLFEEGGAIFQMLLDAEGEVLRKPEPANGGYAGGAFHAVAWPEGGGLVGWTNSQFQKTKMKWLQMHLWVWNNNDLVVRRVRPGGSEAAWPARPELLTRYMSQSTTRPRFARLPDGRALVFWAMKRKVEKPEHQRPDPRIEVVMTQLR